MTWAAGEDSFAPSERNPERQLWASVILTAIADATNQGRDCASADNRMLARRWFTSAGRDFRLVCDYAGLNPEAVQWYALEKIANAPEVEPIAVKKKPDRRLKSVRLKRLSVFARRLLRTTAIIPPAFISTHALR
jgi:hypothetical protein